MVDPQLFGEALPNGLTPSGAVDESARVINRRYGEGKHENIVSRSMEALMLTPPPAEHPGPGFDGWFWSPEKREWFKTPKEELTDILKGTPLGDMLAVAEKQQARFVENGGMMKLTFEADSYGEIAEQMTDALAEWNGGEMEGVPAVATDPAAPKKRGRGRPKLSTIANPPAAGSPAAPPPAATTGRTRIWNVCAFHAQACAKVAAPFATVAPHECEGCKVMATGQSFDALLGAAPVATQLAGSNAQVTSPTAVTNQPATGMTVDNVKAVMRELVGAKIKATGAKTDAEVEAAAKPISEWLAANFKNAAGAPCQMASEIQVGDYARFVELASKLAADTVPVKKSMFD